MTVSDSSRLILLFLVAAGTFSFGMLAAAGVAMTLEAGLALRRRYGTRDLVLWFVTLSAISVSLAGLWILGGAK